MITNLSTSYKNASNIFGQASFTNKSILNNSNASTMITGNESLLLKSIKNNNKTKSFQKKNRKLKNDIKNLKRLKVEYCTYRDLILQKTFINMKNKEVNKADFFISNCEIYKDYYKKIKTDRKYEDPNSSLTNQIIEQVYDKNLKKLSSFKKKMKTIILLKKFIQIQKENYDNKLIENEINKDILSKLNHKIQNITFITKELDNILTLYSYVKFLGEKKKQLKYENIKQFTQIDYLKYDINELLIKIQTRAVKLAELINMRNLLVCIKEGVLMEDLPLNFTFYNNNYKDILDKIIRFMNNYNIQNNENEEQNFSFPTNLFEFLYSEIILKKKDNNINERYQNYLNLNYQIFQNEEDFQRYFLETQNRVNGFFIYALNENYNKYDPEIDPNIIQIEKLDLIKNGEIKAKKTSILEKLKQENIFLNIYYKNIIRESNLIREYKIKYNEKNNSLRNLNKLLLESVFNSNTSENIKYIYNFNQLRLEKKYKIKGAYIYHTLMKNILEIYKTCPQYILNQHCFHIDEFRFRIKNFHVFINTSNYKIIASETYYLFSVYESAVLYILTDYNRLKNRQREISVFNNIRDNIFNNSKKELFKFKLGLEEKLKNDKLEKIYEKQNKKIIRSQKYYFPDIHLIKLRRNKSQERIFKKSKIIHNNNVNFDYSVIKY